ncbi:DUF1059 domain-containing protein [Modestobacter sp. NPDC049651]|uniref:DUF1059 domain-containing protein n=1 Tax=unclassified Modestobacter TaxID=2643866 RepID=UPI0033F95CF4
MEEFHCGDLIPGCGAAFRAGSDDELLAHGTVHVQFAHGMTEADVTPELAAAARAAIRPVA